MHFPITIATVPFRVPNSDQQPKITYGKDFFFFYIFIYRISYFNKVGCGFTCLFSFFFLEVASEHVEGGLYIGPEFLLGEVYDGSNPHQEKGETVVLYRPVYVTVVRQEQ